MVWRELFSEFAHDQPDRKWNWPMSIDLGGRSVQIPHKGTEQDPLSDIHWHAGTCIIYITGAIVHKYRHHFASAVTKRAKVPVRRTTSRKIISLVRFVCVPHTSSEHGDITRRRFWERPTRSVSMSIRSHILACWFFFHPFFSFDCFCIVI